MRYLIPCGLGVGLLLAAAAAPEKSSKPLNLDFEDGSLKGWTASGAAFQNQPIKGDVVSRRRTDMKSGHQGEYWIGTFENGGDDLTGTLTSAPFKLNQPFASFLIGGGAHEKTRVEVVRADNQQVIFRAHGAESENLRPVVADLSGAVGREVFVRLVDQQTGHWGHLNFDDFKLHATRPVFANVLAPVQPVVMPDVDQVAHAGLSGEEAARAIKLPPGFSAQLFAGEPDVQQPIAMALDHRGRLWIAEAYNYPQRAPAGQEKDRILIFEDTNGDGKFDSRKLFADKLNLVSGLEVGFGGVWVGAAPYLLFIPDRNGDDQPDGEPQILLDGWAYQDTHETLNTFTWGPDGWLYGCHGVFTHSVIGKPGTEASKRTKLNAGIWRYHPTRHQFEVFAEGTSNPWGIDFDANGQCFIEACVIPHLFHIIQGARYHRQAGQHFNPHIYDDIKTIADHVHYAGNKGPHAANNRSDAAGGGHAHAGLMIYLGGSWPDQYRGQIFMNNIHGQRLNMDIPERRGSGFVGRHGKDFLNFDDKWSQVLNFLYDQDGSVFIIDWYDKNQCHHNNTGGHDRSNGRVFKVAYNQAPVTRVNLEKSSDADLLSRLAHRNEWHVRHARRVLQERAAEGKLEQSTVKELRERLQKGKAPEQLRALWALHAVGGLTDDVAVSQLKHANEYHRAWAIQLLAEDREISDSVLKRFEEMAREDKSALVRLYLAAALQRIDQPERRWGVLAALNSRSEDARDTNLPLLVWYAQEGAVSAAPERALKTAADSRLPEILQFTSRRVASMGTAAAYELLVQSLDQAKEEGKAAQILKGFVAGVKGQNQIAMPSGWEKVETRLDRSATPEVRALAQTLGLVFGSSRAMASLRQTLQDSRASLPSRQSALDALLGAKDPTLAGILRALLPEEPMRLPALKGLAGNDEPATPEAIVKIYPSLGAAEKRAALSTLASRVSFAKPLVAALEAGKISPRDLTADLVRQLRSFKQSEIDQPLVKHWGVARETGEDKQKEIARFKKIYQSGGSQPGDAPRGRVVFNKLCVQCHSLFDTGGKVGPDLTGSNRADLDYILQNMVDPNAVIPNDYRTTVVETKDQRIITGVLKEQTDQALTLLTTTETLVVPKKDVAKLEHQEISMMPEELLTPLTEQEVRDLIYYLRAPAQASLPAGK